MRSQGQKPRTVEFATGFTRAYREAIGGLKAQKKKRLRSAEKVAVWDDFAKLAEAVLEVDKSADPAKLDVLKPAEDEHGREIANYRWIATEGWRAFYRMGTKPADCTAVLVDDRSAASAAAIKSRLEAIYNSYLETLKKAS